MYIRRTSIKSRKDGSHYYSYRLVESKRTKNGVRQHTILNLGANFALPREQWPELTKRIEDILSGQRSLFVIGRDIEQLAQSCASRIIASYREVEHFDDGDYREVDLDSIEMSRPRSVGAEHITLEALRLLGLDTKFTELGFNGPQAAAAIGTIIGRCCEPGSELATHAWLQERSGLGELIDHDFNNLSLYGLYQVSDQLLKKKAGLKSIYMNENRVSSAYKRPSPCMT